MIQLRPNAAKRRLLSGEPVLAPILGANSIPDLDTLDLLGASGGIDIAWVEMEHGPWTFGELSDISRTCDLWGITSLVRVDQNVPSIIGRTLDRGIQSVLVPHVNTKAEAERVVRGAYYAPKGERGVSFSRQGHGVEGYLGLANDEVMVVILIEAIEAIENLHEILSVDGIDCFFVAPSDLAQTMGPQYLGRPYHPDVQAVVRDSVRTIVAAGRSAGTAVNETTVEAYLDLGVRLLRFNALAFMQSGLQEFRRRVDALTLAKG
jgi:4-hydroxy-2-oxoheptanedioate aldolase